MELITQQQLRPILEEIGKQAVQLQQDHINDQKNIDGSRFAPLKPSTIASKQRNSRDGVRGNATMRMKATNDFVQNAFQYKINRDGITVFISPLPHKFNKTENARQAYKTREEHGKTNHKSKPTHRRTKQGKVVTHIDIANWQLRGDYDQGKRSSNNPGADFIGFSRNDEYIMTNTFVQVAYPIMKQNITDAIKDAIK